MKKLVPTKGGGVMSLPGMAPVPHEYFHREPQDFRMSAGVEPPAAYDDLLANAPRIDEAGRREARRENFLTRFVRSIGRNITSPDFPLRMAMARAYSDGDGATAARIASSLASMRGEANERRQTQERRESAFNNLIKQGMDPGQAELVMLNPEAFGQEYNTRFRTRDVSPDTSIYTPGFGGGAPQVWTAPDVVEDGPNRVQVNPNPGGQNRTIYSGRLDAEHEADSLGLQRGSPEWRRFMQDRFLGAQGPTSTETTRRGQDLTAQTSRRGQDMSAQTAREGHDVTRRGQDVTAETTRRGQDIGAATTRGAANYQGRGRGRGGAGNAATAVGPNGQRIYFRNGRWVDAQGRPVS